MGKVEVTKVEFKLSDEATKRIETMVEVFSEEMQEFNRKEDVMGEGKAGPEPIPPSYKTEEKDFDRETSRVTIETDRVEGIAESDFSTTEIYFKSGTSIIVEESYEEMNKVWIDGKRT